MKKLRPIERTAFQMGWSFLVLGMVLLIVLSLAEIIWEQPKWRILPTVGAVILPIVVHYEIQRRLGADYGLRVLHWLWPMLFSAVHFFLINRPGVT